MTRDEFIKTVPRSGYGTKAAAKKYADESGKEEFDTDDIIRMYHQSMRWSGCKDEKGLREIYGMNGKTTAMSNGIAGN